MKTHIKTQSLVSIFSKSIICLLLFITLFPLKIASSKASLVDKATPSAEARSLSKTQKNPLPSKWAELKKTLKSRANKLTSPVVQRRLKRIHRVIDQKNSEKKALELINKLEKVVANRPFDLARLYLLKAQVYLSKDQFKPAVLYYNKALAVKALTYHDHLRVLYDLAYLHLMKGNIKKSNQLTNQLFYLSDTISGSLYILKAGILSEQNRKKKALEMAINAIKSTKKPKQSWLAFGAGLSLQQKKYIQAGHLLTRLTARWPNKKQYWKQLSSVYLNIKKETHGLATLDLAYKLDFLEKESEILHLANLLAYKNLPLKCARLITKSLQIKKVKPSAKSYELLGDCWLRAEETKKALRAYKESAQLLDTGRVFSKMGRIYMQQRSWLLAIKSFNSALEKGVKKKEPIYIALGVCHERLKQYSQAIQAFEQIIESPKATGQLIKTAREWIDHVQNILNQKASSQS